MARQYEGQVQFVGVASSDATARMKEFVDRHGVGFFPHAADPRGELRTELRVIGQPNWWFVNGSDGTVEKVYGELGQKGLAARVEALVRK